MSTKPGKIIIYSAQNVIIGIDSSLSIVQIWVCVSSVKIEIVKLIVTALHVVNH